jgi:hypothetical protein
MAGQIEIVGNGVRVDGLARHHDLCNASETEMRGFAPVPVAALARAILHWTAQQRHVQLVVG